MFVATTLALSLVFSPVTALTQAPVGPASPTTSSATPAATPTTPAATPAGPPVSKPADAAASKPAASKPAGSACEKLDYRARVDVDATALGADGQGVATRLRTKVEQELRGNDFMLGAAGDAIPQMTVKVVSLPGEDEGYKYTIDITHVDAHPIKDGSSVGECPLCTESELLEKVVGAARALAPKLRAYVADFNNQPCKTTCTADAQCKNPAEPHCNLQTQSCEAAGPGGCGRDADCKTGEKCNLQARVCYPVEDAPPPGRGLTGKQKAGVALLAVGAIGVGVGIGLLVKKPVAENPMEAWSYTTTKPPGIALLAVGGVAVATGVVLFILGRRPPPRNQVTPVAGAGFYGLSWSGRF